MKKNETTIKKSSSGKEVVFLLTSSVLIISTALLGLIFVNFMREELQVIFATDVSGNISSNTTWDSAGSPYYLTGAVYVNNGVTLTIDSGVEVYSNGYHELEVQSGGTLDVNGSSGNEVIFSHASSTSPNAWQGIEVRDGGTATIDYADFTYTNIAIRVSGGTLTINDSSFDTNNHGIDVFDDGDLTTARNSFTNNTYYPVGIEPDAGTISFGTSTNADTLGTGEDVNGYDTIGLGIISSWINGCPSGVCNLPSRTFAGVSNIPYQTANDLLFNTAGDEFEIDANVIIKSNRTIKMYNGAFIDFNGTSGNEVVLTSYRDDTQGGDTNNDGATTGSRNDWGRIEIYGGTSTIDYTEFYYSGSTSAILITNSSTSLTVQDSLFEEGNAGIDVYNSAGLTTARNTFNSNYYYGVAVEPTAGTVTFGSGANADILGTGGDANGYNALGMGSQRYQDNCPSDKCQIIQRTFAGISNIPYVQVANDMDFRTGGDEIEIAAGVIWKLSRTINIQNGSFLDINGSSGNEVIFTSYRDDTQGGDTNNDGATVGSRGEWARIYISGGTNTIDYADFYYAGSHSAITLSGSSTSLTLQDSLFEEGNSGVVVYNSSSLTTARNTFNSNAYAPLAIEPTAGTVVFGTGANVDILGSGGDANGYNAIGMSHERYQDNCPSDKCQIPQRTFAGISNIPYIQVNNDLEFRTSGDEIEIDAGVIWKTNRSIYVYNGSFLDINGSSGSTVKFTSYRDDSIGGDTNNDGATVGSRGDWARFLINGGTSTIDYAEFHYSGSHSAITLYNSATSLTIQDSLFEDGNSGIVVFNSSSLTTARNTFNRNYYEPVAIEPTAGTITFGSGADTDILGTGADLNGYNAIGVGHERYQDNCPSDLCQISSRTFAGITNIPYNHVYQDIEFRTSGDVIQFDAGVIWKSGRTTYFQSGTQMDVNGSSGNWVYFTSYRDDFIGGDSNNDGNSYGSTADWYSQRLRGSSAHTIDYAVFSFGDQGIYIDGASNVTINDAVFYKNGEGIYVSGTSTSPTLSDINFIQQRDYSIYNNTSTTINAEDLYWGASDGPADTDTGNGACTGSSGGGTQVNDDASHPIDFCPYATSAYNAPAITTSTTSDIGQNAATGNANVTSLGWYQIEEHGHVWSSTNTDPVATDSLLHMKMNDNSDSNLVVDEIAVYNGTFIGGSGGSDNYTSSHDVSGKINGALELDGDDYIDLPDGMSNFPNGYSVSLWAYPTAVKTWARFITFAQGAANDNILLARSGSSNDLVFEVYNGGSSGGKVYATGAIALNDWQHFVATVDSSGNVVLYKNGSSVGSGTTAVIQNVNRYNNYIGKSNWGDALYQGYMDDIRVFDYVLDTTDVSNLYNSGAGTEIDFGYEGISQNGSKTSTGTYTSSLSSLDPTTTYYTRGYIRTVEGVYYYGSVDSFITLGDNVAPTTGTVSIDDDASAVNLTANTTTNVVCEATITDNDGYEDITSVEAKLFRTSVGESASDDDNNHYTISGDSNCVPSNGSGNTEDYTCTIAVEFHADPTDTGSRFESDDWTCRIMPSDANGEGTAGTDTIEMNSLLAVSLTASINFGTIDLGDDTGSTNQSAVVTNAGNTTLDAELSGYNLCSDYPTCSGNTLAVGNEEYSMFPFTYGSGTDLTTSAVEEDLNLQYPNTSPSNTSQTIYWGMGIPAGTASGAYEGENIVTAVEDTFHDDATATWKLNDDADNSTVDESIGTHDGTYTGGSGGTDSYTSTHNTTGVVNDALTFDGNDDITITGHTDFDTTVITLESWIYLASDVGNTQWRILNRQQDNNHAWGLMLFGDGYSATGNEVVMLTANGSGWNNCQSDTTDLDSGEWYHIVGVHDGTNQKIYVNGELANTCSYPYDIASISGNIYIGSQYGSAFYFNGTIDVSRVYTYVLDADDVDYLYNYGAGRE